MRLILVFTGISDGEMTASERAGQVISDFLDQQSKKNLHALCEICVIDVRKYLSRLSVLWPAAIAELMSLQSLDTVAYDVVGEMLASMPGRMAYPVQDFFAAKRRFHDVPACSEELYFWFRPFLCKFTRQAVSRLRHEEESQAENLKRRFRETLKGPDFSIVYGEDKSIALCHFRANSNELRLEKPLIGFPHLVALVEEAFLRTTNRSDWCREIFHLLHEQTKYRNAVVESWVLRAVVRVNINYVNMDAIWHGESAGPEIQRIMRNGASLIGNVIAEARKTILGELVQSGRITNDDSERIAEAATIYLTDWLASGADSLPDYFRLVFPQERHGLYLERFKYPFERTLYWCKELFTKELGESL